MREGYVLTYFGTQWQPRYLSNSLPSCNLLLSAVPDTIVPMKVQESTLVVEESMPDSGRQLLSLIVNCSGANR